MRSTPLFIVVSIIFTPTVTSATPPAARDSTPAIDPHAELPHVLEHLHAPDSIRWFPVASILANREESCIDGRSSQPVLGSPGGDTGEFVSALAAWEKTAQRQLPASDIAILFAEYLKSFGVFYIHSDDHALEHLGTALRADPRFAQWSPALRTPADVHAFVASPQLTASPDLEEAVDTLLAKPANIGCGHLRLMVEQPETYGVREGLVTSVLKALFRTARRQPELIDFAHLAGAHAERSVLLVRTPEPVHAHTLVPGVKPAFVAPGPNNTASTPHEFFVYHPSVAAFIRAETGWFMLEQAARLGHRRINQQALARNADLLADKQIRATLSALAARHPIFRVQIDRDRDDHPIIRAEWLRKPGHDDLTH